MNLGVICARAGSKRIPGKNIRPFAGKPVLAWTIKAAIQSECFDRIIISTDDPRIMGAAREYGIDAPFTRPAALADDHAGTVDVMAHAVEWASGEGIDLTAVACLYPAAPFMTPEDLVAARDRLLTGDWAYVFPAAEFPAPIHRAFAKTETGTLEMFFPEHFPTRSQDLPTAYHDAGQFYWGRPDAWLTKQPMIGPNSSIIEIPRWRVQDIDTPADWAEAEQRWEWIRQ